MATQKEILSAFLRAEMAKYDLDLDAATIQAINDAVVLVQRPSDESEETRTIYQQQDSSGKISATSIKLWNIAQISSYDILQLVGKETGILLFEDTAKKAIYALIMLMMEFYPKLKITFNDQDAQVIFAIAQLKKKAFSTGELHETYNGLFTDGITEERLEASLDALVECKVLRRTAAHQYQLREKIKNLSRKTGA